jgi:hypothetical protein
MRGNRERVGACGLGAARSFRWRTSPAGHQSAGVPEKTAERRRASSGPRPAARCGFFGAMFMGGAPPLRFLSD